MIWLFLLVIQAYQIELNCTDYDDKSLPVYKVNFSDQCCLAVEVNKFQNNKPSFHESFLMILFITIILIIASL
jgi:hypothetical protein